MQTCFCPNQNYLAVIACSHASMSLLQEEIAEEPEHGDLDASDDDDRCSRRFIHLALKNVNGQPIECFMSLKTLALLV